MDDDDADADDDADDDDADDDHDDDDEEEEEEEEEEAVLAFGLRPTGAGGRWQTAFGGPPAQLLQPWI
eukprot:7524935-Pyramimonas_sp.AAC.1